MLVYLRDEEEEEEEEEKNKNKNKNKKTRRRTTSTTNHRIMTQAHFVDVVLFRPVTTKPNEIKSWGKQYALRDRP